MLFNNKKVMKPWKTKN